MFLRFPRPTARRVPSGRVAPALFAALLSYACISPAGAPSPSPVLQRALLREAIDSMVAAPEFRNAHWGILIVDPERHDTLYSLNAGKLFLPASNMKIVTGAVALSQLGPDFRFRTVFLTRGARRDSVIEGDLVIEGRGDPTLSDHMRQDAMRPLAELAESLSLRGVRRIAGRVVAGTDVFPDANHGYGWSWDDLAEPYSAGVDELYFNEGFGRIEVRGGERPGDPVTALSLPARDYPRLRVTARTVSKPDSAAVPVGAGESVMPPAIGVRLVRDSVTGVVDVTGTLAVRDSHAIRLSYASPRAAFLAAFSDALRARGITIEGQPPPDSGALDTLFVTQSPPLREIMAAFEKPSQNQIGEILLKTLGLERLGAGTADSGRRVIEAQLRAWGAERDGFVIRDGSGLSRYNYLTPETIVRTLDAMRRDTAFAVFYTSLPIAGVDGTLANRMRGTPAEGNARAKTGFVAHARSLSGYVSTSDGRLLIFSLLCNNWTVPVRSVERVQDAITAQLASLRLGRG